MPSDRATAAFLSFCASGHPELFGEVFDRTAPELLLVAARLLPPGGDATDVVQQTFLTALTRRRHFDPARAVTPWLLGILVRLVHRERRRLRRFVDPQRMELVPIPDPPAAAATHETAERVRGAVASLPQPYRHMLQLHLVHGLAAHEIATSMERPYRTVQSQLRRGLEMLRRSLPGVAAVTPCRDAALAAIRAHVVRASARTLIGAAWLPWLRLAALAAVLVAPCAWLAALEATESRDGDIAYGRGTRAPRNASSGPGGGSLADVDTHAGQTSHGAVAGTAHAPVRRAVQDPSPSSVSVRVRGRPEQRPLAQARVTASWRNPHRAGLLQATGSTDPEGTVRLTLPDDPPAQVQLAVEAPGHLDAAGTLDLPQPPQAKTDIVLWRAVRGRVRIRDQHGAPVAGVHVVSDPECGRGFRLRARLRGTTGENGTTEEALWPIDPLDAELTSLPFRVALGNETGARLAFRNGIADVVLHLPDPSRVVAGRIVDPRGRAVPGAWVRLVRGRDGARLVIPRARTDADGSGRFALHVPDAEPGPFRLLAGVDRCEGTLSAETFAPGRHDLSVTIPDPPGLTVLVVDEADEPVEVFAVLCVRVHSEPGRQITGNPELRHAGRHVAGRLVLDDVEAGAHRLLVVPDDERLLASGFLLVGVAAGGSTVTVRLHRPQPVRVRVALRDGTAVAGTRVRLRAKLSDHPSPRFVDYRQQRFFGSHWRGCLDLDQACTDVDGVAVLSWQPWDEPVIVRADGPGHVVGELELPRVVPSGPPIEMTVARGATVRVEAIDFGRWPELATDALGHVDTRALRQVRPAIVLRNAADANLQAGPEGQGFAFDASGRAVCDGIPPGRWQLLLQWVDAGNRVVRASRPFGDVVAISGHEERSELDLAQQVPGALRGRVFLDGAPVEPEELGRRPLALDVHGETVSTGVGTWDRRFVRSEGDYRIAGVPPGPVRIEAKIGGRRYRLFDPVVVAPGEEREVDLHFRKVVVRIRLQDVEGRTVADRLARVAGELVAVDAAGWLVLDPAPALAFDVELYAAGVDRHLSWSLASSDPRAWPRLVGRIELDPNVQRSERVLVIAER